MLVASIGSIESVRTLGKSVKKTDTPESLAMPTSTPQATEVSFETIT
jgi:hypothetical protein